MANEYSVGRDIKMDIQDPDRGIQRFSIQTGVDWVPQFTDLTSKGLDGVSRQDTVPNGHRLTFTFDRGDGRIDAYFADREENYFNGNENPLITITETVRNPNGGGISKYRYTGVSLKLTAGGTWRGDSITTQTIEAMASRKRRIA